MQGLPMYVQNNVSKNHANYKSYGCRRTKTQYTYCDYLFSKCDFFGSPVLFLEVLEYGTAGNGFSSSAFGWSQNFVIEVKFVKF